MTQGGCWLVFIGIALSAGASTTARMPGRRVITPSPTGAMGKVGLVQADSDSLAEAGVVHATPLQPCTAQQLAACGQEPVVCTCAETTQQSPSLIAGSFVVYFPDIVHARQLPSKS